MKNLKLMCILIVTGLAGFNTVQAQAVIPLKLTVKLTAQGQGLNHEQSGSSRLYKSTIEKYKVTNKDFLNLLGLAFNTSFTNNVLAIDYDSGDFVVLDKAGSNVVANATTSGFLNNYYDSESDSIRKGVCNHNNDTHSYKYSYTYLGTCWIALNDTTNANSFRMNGLEQWISTYNSYDGKFKESFTLTLTGSGDAETAPDGGDNIPFFLLTGTIKGSGKGVEY